MGRIPKLLKRRKMVEGKFCKDCGQEFSDQIKAKGYTEEFAKKLEVCPYCTQKKTRKIETTGKPNFNWAETLRGRKD